MRPRVGHTVGSETRDVGERIVDLDDRAGAVGDEETLLQRIHQRGAELVAIGEIVGAGPLLFVSPCAVDESTRRHIQRGQRLQQKLQRDRVLAAGVLPVDQPGVVFDDLQHAYLVGQCSPSEFVTDREGVLAPGGQVGPQRRRVLGMEVRGFCHDEVPRCRAASTSASSDSLL